MNRTKIIFKVSILSIIVNVLLTVFKIIFGVLFNSFSLVSDAIHSLSDVFSTFVVMIGAFYAKKESDDDHNYGHEKFESVAGIFLSLFLMAFAVLTLSSAVRVFFEIINNTNEYISPSKFALIAAFVSIVTKELMFRYTVNIAEKIKSPALKADAWHHRSDALSSIASFIAIIGSLIGFNICDPIGSVIICILIFKVALDILKESVNQITDKAAPSLLTESISSSILENSDVLSIVEIKTRAHASKLYVDVSITVDKNISVYEGHEIAEKIHDDIENKFEDVLHMNVHVEPHQVSWILF